MSFLVIENQYQVHLYKKLKYQYFISSNENNLYIGAGNLHTVEQFSTKTTEIN